MPLIQIQDTIVCGDCFEVLPALPTGSVDLVFSDPPYFLSGGGTTCKGGKRAPVDKGDWDKSVPAFVMHDFNLHWIGECLRVLRPGGAIWICGTLHNVYSCGFALQQLGARVLNEICWIKDAPPPNLGRRCLTHAHESLIWAVTQPGPHTYNYSAMRRGDGCGRQLKDVWRFGRPRANEYAHGKHPTQKPEALVERILLASSKPGDLVVDPFGGSCTTAVVARRTGRRYVVIEREIQSVEMGRRRVAATAVQGDLFEDRGSDPRAARDSG